jgi:hypothetical protein
MRPDLYGMAAAAAATFTTLSAQGLDAIAVHLPEAAMAGGELLPAGNYTVSTLKGGGEVPVLRFQSETGESIAVIVTREYLPSDRAAQHSEVQVTPDGWHGLRIDRIVMEGCAYQFLLPASEFQQLAPASKATGLVTAAPFSFVDFLVEA